MVHDILQLSRMMNKSRAIKLPPVSVDRIASEVLQVLQQKAESKAIEIDVNLEDNLHVKVNQDELKQVLMNLIGNAISYTPEEGHVLVEGLRLDDEIVLKIKDNGIGIPEKDQARIFERFYRVDKARSRNAGGTGLGLSIVKWLVEGMEGRLELERARSGV